ncbi:MAG: DegQ family serine endoprotease [Myxococcota bacterium]
MKTSLSTVIRLAVTALSLTFAAAACLSSQRTSDAGARKEDLPSRVTAALLPAPAFAQTGSGPGKTADVVLADVAERVVPSVVNISSEKVVRETGGPPDFGPLQNDPFFRHFFGLPEGGGQPRERREHSLGSGVIVSDKGVVLTNNHVIENADQIRVGLSDGREFEATIVGRDPDSDLGVLQLKGEVKDLRPLPFGDSSVLRLGDVVLAVGNPFGVGQTVTMGIVSAKGRASVGIVEYEDFIQTDAAINPGNSGGALVNMRGELVGINTAILSRSGGYQGIGFAIPVNMARPIMEGILSRGRVLRGWLGVAIQEVTPQLKEAFALTEGTGILVSDVTADGPAAKAGLKRGDVILSLDGQKVESTARFRNAIAMAGPDKEVTLEVLRDGARRTVKVKLGAKPVGGQQARGDAPEGKLGGLSLSELTPALRRQHEIPDDIPGVLVADVEVGSAAARAGFRPGDVIMEVNRRVVKTVRDFNEAFQQSKGVVAVLVHRRGSTLYLALRK